MIRSHSHELDVRKSPMRMESLSMVSESLAAIAKHNHKWEIYVRTNININANTALN